MQYRPDIDGLRAVAVLPVILFHAGFAGFSGGFVGVDVFFVISGYLITAIVLAEHAEGRFSFARFYERRARRILPALFFVMACCLPFAWAWMLPYELAEFGRSIVAVLGFGANVFFWLESDYFAASAEMKPLLHTWSLAVEEQYYFILPGLVFLALRGGMGRAWGVLTGVAALSFALMLLIVFVLPIGPLPSANFYLLPTRAWELLCGSLLALWLHDHARPTGWRAALGGALGLGMIAGSVLLLDDTIAYPSHWTLPPVIGTALVLLCGARVLAWRPLVGIGLISYSAYLWHQPLFAFARIRLGEHPDPALMGALAGVSLGLAWATWRFVEGPFRNRTRITIRPLIGGLATACALFLALGLTLHGKGGVPERYAPFQRDWITLSPIERGAYVRTAYTREALDRPLADDRPNLVLYGDSFSQDLYNMIRETGAFDGYAISALYRPTQCQLAMDDEGYAQVPGAWRTACAANAPDAAARARMQAADVVLIAMGWRRWSAANVAQSLAALGLADHGAVYVLGSKNNLFPDHLRDVLPLAQDRLHTATVSPPAKDREINEALRAALPTGRFIDLHGLLCDEAMRCPVFDPDGALLSYDGEHLTRAGAVHVGGRLFTETPLRAYAPPAASAHLSAPFMQGQSAPSPDHIIREVN